MKAFPVILLMAAVIAVGSLLFFWIQSKADNYPVEEAYSYGNSNGDLVVVLLNPNDCLDCIPIQRKNLDKAMTAATCEKVFVTPAMPKTALIDFVNEFYAGYKVDGVMCDSIAFNYFFKASGLPSPFLLSVYKNKKLQWSKNVKELTASDIAALQSL